MTEFNSKDSHKDSHTISQQLEETVNSITVYPALRSMVAFDIETMGLNPLKERITAAAVYSGDGLCKVFVFMPAVADWLRQAYPAPLGRAGVGSIPANPRRTKRAFFPPLAI